MTNTDNVSALGCYLWNFKVDKKLLASPFQSKSLEALRKSALWDWEKEFVSSYCKQHAGQSVKLVDVAMTLDNQLNMRLKLKARNFEALAYKLRPLLLKHEGKSLFTITRKLQDDSSYPKIICIAPEKEQPEQSFVDNFENISEHVETGST